MTPVDWTRVVDAVATPGGLAVVEHRRDGTLHRRVLPPPRRAALAGPPAAEDGEAIWQKLLQLAARGATMR